VLANASKVVMSVKEGSNIMYIPLDKLMERRGGALGMPAMEEGPGSMPQPQDREPSRTGSGIRQGRVR
jgi:hypothetical protein